MQSPRFLEHTMEWIEDNKKTTFVTEYEWFNDRLNELQIIFKQPVWQFPRQTGRLSFVFTDNSYKAVDLFVFAGQNMHVYTAQQKSIRKAWKCPGFDKRR